MSFSILLLASITSAQCQQTAKDWNTKGDALNDQSKFDEAIQAFDEAIRLDPNFALAWLGKGTALIEQGKFDKAIQACDKAIELIIQAQSIPIPTATNGLNKAASENNGFKILGIDSTAFPKIKANLFIDKFCAMAGNLKKEDFKVKEDDNEAAIDNFYFTGNASGQKLDLAIVFDETTSMDEEINALKSKVKDLTQKINSSKLDARYSLVTFNGADVATKINWTNDADSFRNIIGKLSTSGGNSDLPENSLDGIERALSFGFRPDAQKVIIVVTDEPSQQKGDGKSNSAYTMEDVKSDLLNSSVMLIAVSPDFRNPNVDPNVPRSNLPKYADMRELANEASGLWIDINSADFSTILKQIQGILTGIYVIEYTSPDQTPSENRTVLVSVNSPGCVVDNASNYYNGPGKSTTFNDSDLARAWTCKGDALLNQGKFDEAIQACDEAIRLDPKYADAWANKGGGLYAQGKYDEAIQACDEAIRLDPKLAAAWNTKGIALKGKYDEAIQAFNEAIRLNPKIAVYWENKGVALNDQGKFDEAIQAYNEAIRLDPKYAKAWANKGNTLNAQGKYDEAIPALNEAIRLDPKLAAAWTNKGDALNDPGQIRRGYSGL